MSDCSANSAKPGDKDEDKEERVESQETRPHEGVLKRIFSPTICSPFWCRKCRTTYSMNREPKDRFNLVYLCMLMAGAGFLLPSSSYFSAIDYFFFLYRSEFSKVSEAIPLTYFLTTLLSSTINIGLVGLISIHWRIRFGYIMFAVSLVFIPLLDVGINNCTVSTHVSYYLTLLTIAAVGLGSGVQQSSYYGLSSMLPRRYTQAVMAGESVAAVLVSIARIITKLAIESERLSSIIFFVISLLFILICFCCHVYIQYSPFVKYHMARCQKYKKNVRHQIEETSDLGMEEFKSNSGTYGTKRTLRERPSDPDDQADFSGMSDMDDKKELIPVNQDNGRYDRQSEQSQTFVRAIKNRWLVVKQIWSLMIAIFADYFVTLLVFPGLVSEVQFCEIGDWMPVILIAVFNVTDFIPRWLALLPCARRWSPLGLMVGSISRVILVPVILLCIVPSPSNPVIGVGAVVGVAVLFNVLLGLTNGFFGSVPMINVSKEVDKDKDKELAGTIMTWVLLLALTLGSVLAYALTPLTRRADYVECNNNNTQVFICSHGNVTMTN